MESEGRFYVDKYVDNITRLCQHIDPKSVNMNPVRAYQVDTVQAHYAGQDRNYGTPGPQPSGYQNFMFLTKAEFEHMKAHHPELNDRLRNLRLEVVEALVPVRGPLPPNLVRLVSTIRAGKYRPKPNRKDTKPPPDTNHTTALPDQYPPRQTRDNVVQHEVTGLNSYTAEDEPYEEGDQWGVSEYDNTDDFTDDDLDNDYDDRYINSVRTVRLPPFVSCTLIILPILLALSMVVRILWSLVPDGDSLKSTHI
jgi:hypothetical protein